MLRPLHPVKGFKLAAEDCTFGRVKDFLFDEEHWTVRYMAADTGRWIPHRKVLVSPVSLGKPDWESQEFSVHLTKEQIKEQPELPADAPVTRVYEDQRHKTYDYPLYYKVGSHYAWGYGTIPASLLDAPSAPAGEPHRSEPPQSRMLHSLEEVRGFSIVNTEKEKLGSLDDLVMDDETWTIRYLSVHLKQSGIDQTVFFAPNWFDLFDWENGRLMSSFSKESVLASPKLDPDIPLSRTYEEKLHSYYGMPSYWSVSGESEPYV